MCFAVDLSGGRFHLHYNQKTRYGDMGVVLTSYTMLQVIGILFSFINLRCALLLTEVEADSIFTTNRKPDMGTWAVITSYTMLLAYRLVLLYN